MLRVLLAEDEKIVAEDIRDRLVSLGYDIVAVASSGEEAIDDAAQFQPDLVLMDIRLKGPLDGTETAERILKRMDVPIIYLTAYADEPTLQRAIQTGPFGYLLKPVETRELHTCIEMAFFKHKMEKKLKESEQWLITTLKSIGDAVIATDANGCVKFMNPAAEILTGWRQEEAFDREIAEVFNEVDPHASSSDSKEADILSVLRTPTTVGSGDHRVFVSRDGTTIPIDDNVSSIRDDHGNVTGMVVVFKDATNRHRVEEALRSVSHRILETQESERRRVARELHDSVIQMLSSAQYRLNTIDASFDSPGRKVSRDIQKVKEIVEKSIQEVRRISRNLRPSELDDLGLVPAIRNACDEFEERTCVAVDFQYSGVIDDLPPDVVLTIYRIFQEAMTNVEKHARARSVTVTLAGSGGCVRLAVKDEGEGFDANSPKLDKARQTGMGFVDMLERAQFVGGSLAVNTVPGRGTEVAVEVPHNPYNKNQGAGANGKTQTIPD